MALIIESGAGLANSQSYATVDELRGYAAERGATVPPVTAAGTAACEVLLIKAMDYLRDQRFQGERVKAEQALDWPRYGVWVEAWPIRSDEIPRQLIQAQCALAIEAQTMDLLPTTPANAKGPVISESVAGAVSRAYANNGAVRRVPAIAKADALLRTLLRANGLFVTRA